MERRAAEAELSAADVEQTTARMVEFLAPFMALLGRREQREHAQVYFAGRLRNLPRRTSEPIAMDRGCKSRPLQHFIGGGRWDDDAIRDEMCRQVGAELGSANGVLICDSSGFPKAGDHSVGAQHQYCGRLGKGEMCQVGEFLAYAADGSVALVDAQLYLPKSWANDPDRRDECGVPEDIVFKTKQQLAAENLVRRGRRLPHRWVTGDDDYGRIKAFRDLLHRRHEPYVLEVPSDTNIRLARDPTRKTLRFDRWANELPASAWEKFTVRDGEKGPISVRAAKARVYTPREPCSKNERAEVAVVIRGADDTWYFLAEDTRASLKELVRVGACRFEVEHALNLAKGEVGLDEYETRTWVGWHHHVTLTMLAMWFIVREHRRLKKTLPRLRHRRFDASSPWRSQGPTPTKRSPSWSVNSCDETKSHGDDTGWRRTGVRPHGSKPAFLTRDGRGNTRGIDLAQYKYAL